MISGFHGAPTLPSTDYMDSMRDSPWLLNHVTSILRSNFVENELLIGELKLNALQKKLKKRLPENILCVKR